MAKFFSDGWGNGILSSTLGFIFSNAAANKEYEMQKSLSRYNAELGLKNSKEMAGLNYQYGEQAADNAMNRSKELAGYNQQLGLDTTQQLWDKYNSPSAKVKAYKDAGLNVGLMYSGGGANGTIGTASAGGAAPQGGGASGLGISYPGIATTQRLGWGEMMADTALKAAQARLLNEKAKTEAGENTRGAAEIQNFGEDIKNKKAQRELTEAQTKMEQAATIAQQMTNKMTADTFAEQCEIIRYNLYESKERVRAAVIQNGIQEATSKTQIDTYNANLQLIYKELLLKDSQLKINEKQAEEISSQIFLNLAKTLETNSQTAKNFNDMVISRKQLRVEQFRTSVDAIVKAAGVANDAVSIPIRILDAIIPF